MNRPLRTTARQPKVVAYRVVARDLRNQLLKQAFPPGVPLPTEAVVAEEYAVSRQTVRRAFQDLVAEGLVLRVPGRGTFSAPRGGRYLRQLGSIEDLMGLSADSEMRVLSPLADAVAPSAAARLQLTDDHVATASFVRLHRGEPFSHTTVYLPPAIRAQLGDVAEMATAEATSHVTVIGLLDPVLEAPIQDAEQSISVSALPIEAAESMNLPVQTTVLRIDRTYFDTAGDPVELAISHFHPDRYSYRIRLRRNVG